MVAAALLAVILSACAAPAVDDAARIRTEGPSDARPTVDGTGPGATSGATPGATSDTEVGAETLVEEEDRAAAPRPTWLGTRALPLASDGFGERLPTPPELVDRRLITPPVPHPAPEALPAGATWDVRPVPDAVLARSTWSPDCPVSAEELRYVTVLFTGFDGGTHLGELLVHADVAEAVATVFGALHTERFPLEEVRVISLADLTAPATGDGNVTSAFVCRPTVGGSRWSEHAFGRAVDINPFHNPYVRGDLVLPELAGAYSDRTDVRPGMIVAGDAVTAAFARIGWGWGGDWTGPATDPMHFSASGR